VRIVLSETASTLVCGGGSLASAKIHSIWRRWRKLRPGRTQSAPARSCSVSLRLASNGWPLRAKNAERIAEQHLGPQIRRQGFVAQGAHDQVDLAAADAMQHRLVGLVHERDLDFRILREEAGYGHRHQRASHEGQRADAQPASRGAAQGGYLVFGRRKLGQHPTGAAQKRLAGSGQRHARRRPREQPYLQPALQIAQRARDGGLRDVAGARGRGDAAMVRDCRQHAQLLRAYVHPAHPVRLPPGCGRSSTAR
jgi:hypothetical protein